MRKRIIIAGAGILDVLVCPVEAEVFKKGSVPVDTIKITTGGDALNEATVLAKLKNGTGIVSLVTVLGQDQAGSTILEHCKKEGISTEFIIEEPSMETGVNIVMVQKDGSRSFFTNPKSSLRRLGLEHIPETVFENGGIFCLASIFVSPKLGSKELEQLFRRAKAGGMCVCADMTKCKHGETTEDIRGVLGCLDYLFANEEEAGMLTGETKVEKMAETLFSCGVKCVLIKCGARGCYVRSAEITGQFPAYPKTRCIDTTGAGDAFAAGFLYALSEEKPLRECIYWANTCGSLAVEAVGACEGIQNRAQAELRLEDFFVEKQ